MRHHYNYEYVEYEPRGVVQHQTIQTQEQYAPSYSNVGPGFPIFVGLISAAIITGIVIWVVDSQFKSSSFGEYQPKIKRSKKHMPKIFKFALYLALVKLVWMAVNAAPQIAQFITSQVIK